MIKVLTRREREFLQKLAALIKQYNAGFSYNYYEEEIQIEMFTNCLLGPEPIGAPIGLIDGFNERDIYDLLEKEEKDLKTIMQENAARPHKAKTNPYSHP